MKRILYLYRDSPFARFIRDDAAILRQRYEVDEIRLEARVSTLARLLLAAARCDLVYFWWGDITGVLGAALATMRRKPSIMITGGYDVANVPEIRYGLRYHPWRRFLPPIALDLATAIVANAETTRTDVVRDFAIDGVRIRAIPHGLDPNAVTPGTRPKERRVLTCSLLSKHYIAYKGLDTFVAAAGLLPDVAFVHAGPDNGDGARQALEHIAPPNLTFLGFLSQEALIDEMRRALVYAQLSAHEGFGLALAEAMLAGATPVVTRAGAIPEVVGPVGHYIDYGDAEACARAIRTALDHPAGDQARARIVEQFPLERRAKGLFEVVEKLLGACASNEL
jgi:glycosyltransferase involved in cell wall biosynthesis